MVTVRGCASTVRPHSGTTGFDYESVAETLRHAAKDNPGEAVNFSRYGRPRCG